MRFQDLLAYRKSFNLAMEIFHLSKHFPKEETYSLTDQVRRSSRSVCANISEAYRKRLYPKHFTSKLTDSDAENSETQTWLEFSLHCEYISKETYNNLMTESSEVGKLINYMIQNPGKFGCNQKTSDQ
ncbi:four helix bundle protein [Flavivirga eckloniae]|uniref:Diversity-generating retroelement protein bAvd family protein n=1 Tax=Flavivirga eckloniae TaxID=1803846 RepID=A0A2K9PL08_9FLAO|nr:four helix bundle protein [Flavivirga eckloniae]AUP77732.1 diversity-generating retroelement protein bAvd family protein [Flavivirga eckloniae]